MAAGGGDAGRHDDGTSEEENSVGHHWIIMGPEQPPPLVRIMQDLAGKPAAYRFRRDMQQMQKRHRQGSEGMVLANADETRWLPGQP